MKDDLLKQWQQDVEDYGDNAYLMWEVTNSNKEYYLSFANQGSALFCVNNVNNVIDLMRRKQSAELPFDLERAKCGDVVEYHQYDDYWANALDNLNYSNDFYYRVGTVNDDFIIDDRCKKGLVPFRYMKTSEFRMKYPPKVKK